jgi:hypothetical protein
VDNKEFARIIRKIVARDFAYEAMWQAGEVSEAKFKAYQAKRAELIRSLDEARGTTDVTYEEFRAAFDDGAACDVLVELKNGMHPKDPLKGDAVKDLRSVGCYSSSSKRRRH